MKRYLALLMVFLTVPLFVRAQDAATEEQLNKLRSEVSALQTSNVELQKRVADLSRELAEVRESASKPAGHFADADDVKQLAEKIREVDRSRIEDRELILKELKKIAKPGTDPNGKKPVKPSEEGGDRPPVNDKGYEYVIASGDTLSSVVQAYREKGVKVTVDQVLKANPGLKATSLKVGQKIFIPSPAQ